MTQFDVYRNPLRSQQRDRPYLLEVQSPLLGAMLTTVVVPLVLPSILAVKFDRLTPLMAVDGVELRLSVTEIFSIPRQILGAKVTHLDTERDRIIAALDHLISGF